MDPCTREEERLRTDLDKGTVKAIQIVPVPEQAAFYTSAAAKYPGGCRRKSVRRKPLQTPSVPSAASADRDRVEDLVGRVEERTAIMEYDGGSSREEADRVAEERFWRMSSRKSSDR